MAENDNNLSFFTVVHNILDAIVKNNGAISLVFVAPLLILMTIFLVLKVNRNYVSDNLLVLISFIWLIWGCITIGLLVGNATALSATQLIGSAFAGISGGAFGGYIGFVKGRKSGMKIQSANDEKS